MTSSRCAIVTGASRGIGARLSQSMSSAGWRVIGVSRTPVAEWQDSWHDNLTGYQCDLTDESQVKRLFSTLRKEHGPVDVLVNNAGVFNAQLLQMSTTNGFQSVLNSNLASVFLTTREYSRLMRQFSRGRVVSISSIAAVIPVLGNSAYGISKQAVERLMVDFAVEFRDYGITFNSIEISFSEESGMAQKLNESAKSKYSDRLLYSTPISISEISHAVEFFASPLAQSITGHVLSLGSSI